MKPIGKKILTGTIAASFLLGGGLFGILHTPQAQAADTGTTTQQTSDNQASGTFKKGDRQGFGFRGNNVFQQAATVLGVDQKTLMSDLQQGKSLAEIAQDKGLTEDDFLAKLVSAETTTIDSAVSSGKLTQDQADKLKTNLSDRLKKEIENKGFKKGEPKEGFGGNNVIQQAVTILGVDQKTLIGDLQQGKTLAQIAQDKGLTEDDFLAKLVAAESSAIDSAVSSGKLTQEQADKQKTNLSDRLKKEIEKTKNIREVKKGFGPFGNSEAITKILGITQEELKTELQSGKSLAEIAEAKGISEDQLISQIKDSMTDQIKKFVEGKKQAPKKAESQDAAQAQTAN